MTEKSSNQTPGAGAGTAIRVLSAAAMNRGLLVVAERLRNEGGPALELRHATAPKILAMFEAGAVEADVVLAPDKTIAALGKIGRIETASRIRIGRVGAGIMVRSGAAMPDVSTTASLTGTLLAADAVIHNRASSGIYIAAMIDRLGIRERLGERLVVLDDAEAVVGRLRAGRGTELGFTGMTEIMHQQELGNVRLAGPLPDELQNYTEYWAAPVLPVAADAPARDLLAYLASRDGRAVFAASGVV